MKANGGLKVIDVEADDIPYPAKIQWSGLKTDEGSPWMLPPEGQRCAGRSYVRDADGDYVLDANNERLQRPCWNWPMKGTTVCVKHGGGITRVRKAAIERMASALDAATGELVRLALGARDEKVRAQAIASLMDRIGIRAGMDLNLGTEPQYLEVLKNMFTEAGYKDPGDEGDTGE
jgi:hypothetical protein